MRANAQRWIHRSRAGADRGPGRRRWGAEDVVSRGTGQAMLARRIGTQQSGVARMENAGCTSYTTITLAKIAAATGSRLEVRIVPARSRRPVLTMR